MLPPDFHWRSVASRPDGKDDSVFCEGTQVLRLSERINGGGWFADLDTQRPDRGRWTTRECTSYDQGVVGAELWAERHQNRLRAEVDQRLQQIGIGKPVLRWSQSKRRTSPLVEPEASRTDCQLRCCFSLVLN